jgi:hypothetical protein
VTLIPAAVLQFTAALTGNTRRRRPLLAAAWSGSAVFAAIFVSTPLMLAGTWRYWWGFYPRLAPATGVFLLFFGIVLTISLI